MKHLKTINELYSDTYLSARDKTRYASIERWSKFHEAYLKELYKELTIDGFTKQEIIMKDLSNEISNLLKSKNIPNKEGLEYCINEYKLIHKDSIYDIEFYISEVLNDSIAIYMNVDVSIDDDYNDSDDVIEFIIKYNKTKNMYSALDLDTYNGACSIFEYNISREDYLKIEQELKTIYKKYNLTGNMLEFDNDNKPF